jgi:GT2 family glycosyltransferase
METHPNIAANGTQLAIFTNSLKGCIETRMTPVVVQDSSWKEPKCLLAHPSAIYRKSVLEKVGYYTESALHYEDLDLWSKLYKEGYKLTNLPTVHMLYRKHSDSICTKNADRQARHSQKLFKRMWEEEIPKKRQIKIDA